MKAQRIIRTIVLFCMISFTLPAMANDVNSPVATTAESPTDHARRLENRLEEIKAMDVKSMSKAEKKALRKEVRSIKKEMAEISGGVYISVGALLLIILLILLLA